jgi:hypothetical protein
MSQKSPFSHLFQLFGSTTEKHVDSINRDALKKMMTLLQLPVDAAGRCILLRAPRAGYGKSHLLTRAQSQLGSSHEFILLQPANGYRVDANAVLNDVISKLTRALPGGAGLTALDLYHLFSYIVVTRFCIYRLVQRAGSHFQSIELHVLHLPNMA